MNKELRILVLEDVPADVVLIDRELRQAGISFAVKRVETRDEFARELEENPPDLILSDHGLPSFDGFAALGLARSKFPDIPFIFVTGSMGEELAIESLRGGATDYVLKSRLANLAPAVERALRLASERTQREMAERELRASEERFRLLVSGVQDYAICILDADGRVTSWNAGAERLLGFRAAEVLGKSAALFYRPTDRQVDKPANDLRVAAAEGLFQEEGWRVRKGDTPFWAHVDLRALRADSGEFRGFTHVIRDLTEQMQAQEALRGSEERYRRLVELCPDALLVLQLGTIVFVNRAAQRLLGAQQAEQLFGHPLTEFIHPDSREAVAGRLQQLEERTSLPQFDDPGRLPTPFLSETLTRADGTDLAVELGAVRTIFHDEPALQVIIHDVTAQRQAAAALRKSEAHKTAILETSLDAIVSLDQQGLIREWNSAAEHLLGYSRDQAIGSQVDDLIAVKTTGVRPANVAEYLQAGTATSLSRPIEVTARRSAGEEVPMELSLRPIAASAPPVYTAFLRDLTERKRAEAALRASEARKTAILETALDAIVVLDAEGKILEWNPAANTTFGYSRELMLGRAFAELMTSAANEELSRKGLKRYLQTGRGRLLGERLEVMALRANGAEFPVELAIANIAGLEHPVFASFIRDITERRRTEEALRKSEERFRLLVEGVEDYAIYALDLHGRVNTWNTGAERIHGYRVPEIVGRRFHRFYPSEDIARKKPDHAIAIATAEGRYQDEPTLLRKGGAPFWASVVITALRDDANRLTGFSMIARDITRRKEAEEEILRLNRALERQVQERTAELHAAHSEMEAFSYSISHDLRAPLIHIAGFVEMLKSDLGGGLDERSRRHLDTICSATEHLGRMIADLLALSRIGRAEMHQVRLNLGELVRDVQRELSAQLQNRVVDWRVDDLPEVYADPILLRQALVNLLANALKFTRRQPDARIELGRLPNSPEPTIFIRDNGVGFDQKYAGKLFGVFQRLHATTEFEGTGIGLAKTRRIIHRHGGRIWAESEPNAGATFYFTLPRVPAP